MKNILFFLVVFMVFLVKGQSQQKSGSSVITITGTRLVYPIMQQWANEFHRQHPDITFQIGANQPGETVDLQIISHSLGEKDLAGGKSYVALARYIQLPVVNKERKDLPDLISRGFSDKAIKNIYFAGNTNENSSQEENPFTVYTRSKPACASISFAQHFGHEQKDISGIGVNGDDRDLLTAIKRDINGLSYNNLGFIYNLQTRQVTDSIAIVPIDLNDNGKIDGNEKIYGTIDEVIAFQEKNNHPRIPVEFVYVVYQKAQSKEATDAFINWIITKGQDYNNDYGFLTLNNTQPVK